MRFFSIFLVVIFRAFTALYADPAEGFYLCMDEASGKVKAGWELYVKDGALYGKILSVAGFPQDVKAANCKESYKGFPFAGNVKDMPVVGSPWIFGLKNDAPGVWSAGFIIDPENGAMYGCKITLHKAGKKHFTQDTLEMRGTMGPLGRSQFWEKSGAAEASGVR